MRFVSRLVLFVCAAFLVIQCQKRCRKIRFLSAEENSLRGDYASRADDIIKSAWTEKKGRVGVRKMGLKWGIERLLYCQCNGHGQLKSPCRLNLELFS